MPEKEGEESQYPTLYINLEVPLTLGSFMCRAALMEVRDFPYFCHKAGVALDTMIKAAIHVKALQLEMPGGTGTHPEENPEAGEVRAPSST